MAAQALTNRRWGLNGRFRTLTGEYTHATGADRVIESGFNYVHFTRIQNLDTANNNPVITVSKGAVTVADASVTNTSDLVVYMEGW